MILGSRVRYIEHSSGVLRKISNIPYPVIGTVKQISGIKEKWATVEFTSGVTIKVLQKNLEVVEL